VKEWNVRICCSKSRFWVLEWRLDGVVWTRAVCSFGRRRKQQLKLFIRPGWIKVGLENVSEFSSLIAAPQGGGYGTRLWVK
jgi:hypothetical protein